MNSLDNQGFTSLSSIQLLYELNNGVMPTNNIMEFLKKMVLYGRSHELLQEQTALESVIVGKPKLIWKEITL